MERQLWINLTDIREMDTIKLYVLVIVLISRFTGFYTILWFFCSVGVVKCNKNKNSRMCTLVLLTAVS